MRFSVYLCGKNDMKKIKTVAVIGAGTMGSGIAQVSALSGYEAILFDLSADLIATGIGAIMKNLAQSVEKGKLNQADADAALGRIETTDKLTQVKADFVIEAVVENLDVKQKIFTQLEEINPGSILATNTSSIPITKIASALREPSRCVGLHFFNPAHIMKLVEVVAGEQTSEDVINTTKDFAKTLGKIPVMAKDSPGFIVNRVARHFYVESLKLAEDGAAPLEVIDRLIESSGFRMGPFRLMDLIGVDTNLSVTKSIYEGFGRPSKFKPSSLQQSKVDKGELGVKTGKGFYEYKKV